MFHDSRGLRYFLRLRCKRCYPQHPKPCLNPPLQSLISGSSPKPSTPKPIVTHIGTPKLQNLDILETCTNPHRHLVLAGKAARHDSLLPARGASALEGQKTSLFLRLGFRGLGFRVVLTNGSIEQSRVLGYIVIVVVDSYSVYLPLYLVLRV